MTAPRYSAIAIGASAGGVEALAEILGRLPADYGLPLLVVQHLHPSDGGAYARHLNERHALAVSEASPGEAVRPGRVYLAPANYHLLVERDATLALSTDEKVNWSRPSIDVLFESAARAWAERLVGVILTGASSDGALGIGAVKRYGGLTIAQDPATALHAVMPRAAIDTGAVDEVLSPPAIGERLLALGGETTGGAR